MESNFKKLLIYSVFAVFLFSCSSSDESSKTSVKYIVTSTADMITSLTYRNANGQIIEAIGETPSIEWSRSINVDLPFSAHLEVVTANVTAQTEQYDLAVYVDGELVDYIPAQTPPGATDSTILEYDVN